MCHGAREEIRIDRHTSHSSPKWLMEPHAAYIKALACSSLDTTSTFPCREHRDGITPYSGTRRTECVWTNQKAVHEVGYLPYTVVEGD